MGRTQRKARQIVNNIVYSSAEVSRKSNNSGTGKPHILDWYPMDTKERFYSETIPQSHRDIWINKKISYDLNTYGFRSDEFVENRESITILGCSYAFGIGMPNESIWPTLLSKKMGMPVNNISIPGGSLDSAFRVYNEWQPLLKSKYTILLTPQSSRFELGSWGSDSFKSFGPWMLSDEFISENDYLTESVKQFLLEHMCSKNYVHVNSRRNLSAINYIARETSSSLVSISCLDMVEQFRQDNGGDPDRTARDYAHHGFKWHKYVAEKFYEEMKK